MGSSHVPWYSVHVRIDLRERGKSRATCEHTVNGPTEAQRFAEQQCVKRGVRKGETEDVDRR